MPEKITPGRPKGSGCNYRILNLMQPDGNPLFDVPPWKMQSIRTTAIRAGIRIKIRRMVGLNDQPNGLYAIQRIK